MRYMNDRRHAVSKVAVHPLLEHRYEAVPQEKQ